jgi:DNA polymerase II small subunit
VSERLQMAISFAIASGYQLEKGAFEFLETMSQAGDPVQLMEEAIKRVATLPEKPLFINQSLLEEAMKQVFPEKEEAKPPPPQPIMEARKAVFHAYAKDVDANMKVIEDPTDKICTTGSIEEYLEYFQDRFKRIRGFLRKRVDTKDATTISEALKAPVNSKVKIIGMITEKRERKQRIFLRVDDFEASATVLVPSKIIEKTQALLLDQVICMSVIKGRNDLLIAKDFLLPNVPQKTPNKASIPVYAALLSDLHVGSEMFMREALQRFMLWLNGRFGNKNLRETASHVKYVIIAGDLVDGIGIYPGQMKELAIRDIYEQYQAVAKFMEQIPDYIELIIIPGNHDASRKALPQPAISRDYAEPVYEARKVLSLGDPAVVSLHDVELLLYHGRSLDDIVGAAPNVSFHTPDKAMKLLLQSRHLAPAYGQKTPIAPEKRDFMVIERVPDIFHTGHVHVMKHDTYRGILMVNSGAWQSQTEYQRKMGLEPTPGIVPVVNLQTLGVTTIPFAKPYV